MGPCYGFKTHNFMLHVTVRIYLYLLFCLYKIIFIIVLFS